MFSYYLLWFGMGTSARVLSAAGPWTVELGMKYFAPNRQKNPAKQMATFALKPWPCLQIPEGRTLPCEL